MLIDTPNPDADETAELRALEASGVRPRTNPGAWLEAFQTDSLAEFIQDYLDVDGVLPSAGALILYQKLVLALTGHDERDLLSAFEKTCVRMARISAPRDMAAEEMEAVAAGARDRAERLFRRLRLENLPPHALYLTLAGLFAYTPDLLQNPLAGEPER